MFFREEVKKQDTTKAEMLRIANSALMSKLEQCLAGQEKDIREQLTRQGIVGEQQEECITRIKHKMQLRIIEEFKNAVHAKTAGNQHN